MLAYKQRLQAIDPHVNYLMSLYLHPSITPETVHQAKAAGIAGIKSYPAGVTTNSSSGVLDYASFYPVFAAMEAVDLVLNLHGESPPSPTSSSDADTNADNAITVLNAEAAFLPTLLDLHHRFPKLRIVLEHCTTAAAIAAVRSCGPNVVGTITAHHLFLTVDDWAGDPINFCKPVAKLPADRLALLRAAVDGSGKFFFGSDSAPHLLGAKRGTDAAKCAAGVFTQPYVVGYVLEAFEAGMQRGLIKRESVAREVLEGFLGGFGRRFYGVSNAKDRIKVKRDGVVVKNVDVKSSGAGGQDAVNSTVVSFRSGKATYSVEWI